MASARDDFSPSVLRRLRDEVGNRCSNPHCRAPTSGPSLETGTSNVGVGAHITAASDGGPRYDPALTNEERASERNGIWLCGRCARLVDNDVTTFTEVGLRDWKTIAIETARQEQITGSVLVTSPIAIQRRVNVTIALITSGNALTSRLHFMLSTSRKAVAVVRDHGVREEVISSLRFAFDEFHEALQHFVARIEDVKAAFPDLAEPTLQLMMFRDLAYTLGSEWRWQWRTRLEGVARSVDLMDVESYWDRFDWKRVFDGEEPDAGLVEEFARNFSRRMDDWGVHILAGRPPSEWWPARQAAEQREFESLVERNAHLLTDEKRRDIDALISRYETNKRR